jgi:cell division protein FtsN
MIRSRHGEMTFNAKHLAILLISAASIAGLTFAIGYLSGSFTKGKETEKAPTAGKPNSDAPAAPGAITKKLDTDAILKEREIEKSAGSASHFTFQKTLMKDTPPAKETPPTAQPVETAKVETKEPPPAAIVDKRPDEPKIAGQKQAQEKKPSTPAPKENKAKPRHDTEPTTAKSATTPGKMFTIQVASFSTKADADRLVARLAAKRFITNIQEFKDKGATWYRVRVGVYKTEPSAIRDLGKVKAEVPHAFVTGY